MIKLSENDKDRIKASVLKAEKETSGEIVPVIVRQSDIYPAAHFRWSLILAFVAMTIPYFIETLHDSPEHYFTAFVLGALLGYLVAYIRPLKKIMVTKVEMEEEFRQRAFESFLVNGVSETKERNGVQLFVSAFEHKAMILGDIGIQKELSPKAWQDLVDDLIPYLKKRQYTEGFCHTIEALGTVLAEKFPDHHEDEDELANKIIIEV